MTSWVRSIKDVREGKANVLLGAYCGDAPDFVFHEHPAAISRMVFWKSPENDWKFDGVSSLKGVNIGLIKDYSYGDSLDAYFSAHPGQVEESSGKDPLVSLVRRLKRGQVDVIIKDSWVMGYFLETHRNSSGSCLLAASRVTRCMFRFRLPFQKYREIWRE